MPLAVPPYFQPVFYPLSALRVLEFPAGLPHVQIVSTDQETDADVAAATTLVISSNLPAAAEWTLRWRTVLPELRALAWLSEFGQSVQHTFPLPPFNQSHPEREHPDLGLELPIDQCLRIAFDQPPAGVRFVPRESITAAEAAEFAALLKQQDPPDAHDWERFYTQLAQVQQANQVEQASQ
ncbi:MAG: hypothetical protein K1X74_10645 [Pirellulales bacterium]|nr:hypothetical protein [Pirellulales bacterium]